MPAKAAQDWLKRFVKYRVLHINDTPHRIALGLAIGIFAAWTPAIGLQMALVVLLCWLFRANKIVGLPLVWISNPATVVPIYMPNFILGQWLLGTEKELDFGPFGTGFQGSWIERVRGWWELTIDVFWPLWVGSLLVGLVLAVGVYFSTYHAVIYYRKKRPHLKLKLPLRHLRQARQARKADAARAKAHQPSSTGAEDESASTGPDAA